MAVMFIFLEIFFILLGTAMLFSGFVHLRRKRLVENLPLSKIRSVAMGLVEISGKVVAAEDDILISPISRKNCVYYKVVINTFSHKGKKDKKADSLPAVYTKAEEMRRFYLKDETGLVIVDPKGANVRLQAHYNFTGINLPDNVRKFLEEKNMLQEYVSTRKSFEYNEFLICPGDNLYIIGTASQSSELNQPIKDYKIPTIKKAENRDFDDYYQIASSEEDLLDYNKVSMTMCFTAGPFLIIISIVFLISQFNLW